MADVFKRKKAGRKPLPPADRKVKLYFFVRKPEAAKLKAYAEKLERERLERLRGE